MTTSWPIDATGSLPVCFSVILKFAQDEGTVIDPTLYCIVSLASISVLQSVTVAASLPFALEVAGANAAVAGDAAGAVAAGAAVIGLAIGAVEAGDAAVPADAGALGDWDWEWFPHAESTSVQATTSAGIFRFIIRPPLAKYRIVGMQRSTWREGGRRVPSQTDYPWLDFIDIASTRAWPACATSRATTGVNAMRGNPRDPANDAFPHGLRIGAAFTGRLLVITTADAMISAAANYHSEAIVCDPPGDGSKATS